MAGTLSLFPASSLQCLLLSFTKFTPKICVAPNNSSAPAARSRSVKACLGGEENNGMTVKHNYRPLANFHPSIWKDTFFSIPSDDLVKYGYKIHSNTHTRLVYIIFTAAFFFKCASGLTSYGVNIFLSVFVQLTIALYGINLNPHFFNCGHPQYICMYVCS